MEAVYLVIILAVGGFILYLYKNKPSPANIPPATNRYQASPSAKLEVVQVYELANTLRIVLDSARIINETKNYEVKLSRTKLLNDSLQRLNRSGSPHLTKDESWTKLLASIEEMYIRMQDVDIQHSKYLEMLKAKRSSINCPNCNSASFADGSRAVKCNSCGEKAHRLKTAKTSSILITLPEYAELQGLESKLLGMFPSESVGSITVSPTVAEILDAMASKLSEK